MWKTTNGGASWTPLADLLANINVSAMAMDPANPNLIYAGTGEGFAVSHSGAGVFKTTDGGASWIMSGLVSSTFINDIVISPTNSQRIYAATVSGLWRSLDGGATWTQMDRDSSGRFIQGCSDMVIRSDSAQDYVFAACGINSPATIYRNADAGGNGAWQPILGATAPVNAETQLGRTSLALAPSNQSIVYALASSIAPGSFNRGLHAVYRSTDGGSSWEARVRNNNPQ